VYRNDDITKREKEEREKPAAAIVTAARE